MHMPSGTHPLRQIERENLVANRNGDFWPTAELDGDFPLPGLGVLTAGPRHGD